MDILPWTEIHKPRSLEQLYLDVELRERFSTYMGTRKIPNLLLIGGPGVGKTCTTHLLLKTLFDREKRKKYVLEWSSADDRGIKAVQQSMGTFCKKMINPIDVKSVPSRFIVLDGLDNMTDKAQSLISKLMEQYDATTKFIVICSNSDNILEGIQSRCELLYFRPISEPKIKEQLKIICSLKKIAVSDEGIDALGYIAHGDLRKAINYLQLIALQYKRITAKNVYKLCGKPDPVLILEIFVSCQKGNLKKALGILQGLKDAGHSIADLSLEMSNVLESEYAKGLPLALRMEFMEEVCNSNLAISRGMDTLGQLSGCIAQLYLLALKPK